MSENNIVHIIIVYLILSARERDRGVKNDILKRENPDVPRRFQTIYFLQLGKRCFSIVPPWIFYSLVLLG